MKSDEKPESDLVESLFTDDASVVPFDPFDLNAELTETYENDPSKDDDDGDDGEKESNITQGIDGDDFVDPVQHKLFLHLKKRVREACNVAVKPSTRRNALEWMFVPNMEDRQKHSFELICQVLGGRAGVLRARALYQLWNANVTIREPLPFLSAMPPTSLLSEVSANIAPVIAERMAREAWFWPSIPGVELRERLSDESDKRYKACLDGMISGGYMGVAGGRMYFISRNPTLMNIQQKNKFSFASSIYGAC